MRMKSIWPQVSRIFILLPIRLKRLFAHLFFISINQKIKVNSVVEWWTDLLIYVIEWTGLFEVWTVILHFFKGGIRDFDIYELTLLNEVFGPSIDLSNIRINDSAQLFTKSYAIAYVTGFVINYDSSISDKVLVHEVVHCLQYQKFGLVYSSRALLAQRSAEGYSYGGYMGLNDAIENGKNFLGFNFEQQAQIIEDYFEVRNRPDLALNPLLIRVYNHYFNQMISTFQKKVMD